MFSKKRILSIILSILLCVNLMPALAEGETETLNEDLEKQAFIQQYYDEHAIEPQEDNSDLWEEIEASIATQSAQVLAKEQEYASQAASAVSSTSDKPLINTEDLQKKVSGMPYNVQNNNNETISMSTGSVNYSSNLISLAGVSGLDLNVTLNYSSANSTKSYDSFKGLYTQGCYQNFRELAAGWSFNFTSVTRRMEGALKSSITLSDGASYQITNDTDNLNNGDINLKLRDYYLTDISVKRNAQTKEYEVSYLNGRKEYLDGTYGNLQRTVDRFGNQITFDYELIDFTNSRYPGTKGKLNVLKKITDSTGKRIVTFDYTLSTDQDNDNYVSQIVISASDLLNGQVSDTIRYATLTFDRRKILIGDGVSVSQGGNPDKDNVADRLRKIIDADNLETSFTYYCEAQTSPYADYLTTHVHIPTGGSPQYNTWWIALKKVTYPTGGWTAYEYAKYQRHYKYTYISHNIHDYNDYWYTTDTNWYEVYKPSKRTDSSGHVIDYVFSDDHLAYDEPDTNLTSKMYVNGRITQYVFSPDMRPLSEETYAVNLENGTTKTKTTMAYNTYNQLISKTTSLEDLSPDTDPNNKTKELHTEYWDYVNKKNVVTCHTDIYGNDTEYEYTNSPYYIPTKVTKFANSDNLLVTEYTLSTGTSPAGLSKNGAVVTCAKTYNDDNGDGVTDRTTQIDYSYLNDDFGILIKEDKRELQGSTVIDRQIKDYTYDSKLVSIASTITKYYSLKDDFSDTEWKEYITYNTYYPVSGLLKTYKDELGRTTTYEYDNSGNLTKTINPDGTFKQTTYTYNTNGVNKITNSLNGSYITVDYYDGLGRLTKNCDQSGNQEIMKTEYTYANGRLAKVEDANENYVEFDYDVFDRTVGTFLWTAGQTTPAFKILTYDDYNKTQSMNQDLHLSTVYFDQYDRVIQQSTNSAAGECNTYTEYDYMGNVVKTTDAEGGETHYTYNNAGTLLSVTDAMGGITQYRYNQSGKLNAQVETPGGSVIASTFDSIGRVIEATDAAGQKEFTVYDGMNRPLKAKDRSGQITSYAYKPNTDLLQSQVKGGTSISYTYDALGNVLTMTDSTGTTAYEYTYNNQCSKITAPDGKSISYTYDAIGNLTNVNDYNGQDIEYTYNGLGQITAVSCGNTAMAQYTYDGYSGIQSVTYPGQGSMEYIYDNAMRMTGMVSRLSNNTAVHTYAYTYDKNGNALTKTDNSQVTTYDYDALNRLSGTVEPDGTNTDYSFDKNGNITLKEMTHPASYSYSFQQDGIDYSIQNPVLHNVTYAYDENNRLLQEMEYVEGTSENFSGTVEAIKNYTYDNNGNLVKAETSGQIDEEVIEYAYTSLNQLKELKKAGNIVATYQYDGTGMRTGKSVNGIMTKYYWDRGNIINEVRGDGMVTNYFGAKGIIARENGGSRSYMLKNGHGDVTALVSGGTVTESYDFDAYGLEKDKAEDDTNPFRYSGEYYDDESGLIYLRARYYAPSMGRFITEDPAKDGMNWYAYCAGNPVMFVDPSGLAMGAPSVEETTDYNYTHNIGHSSTNAVDVIEMDNYIFIYAYLSFVGDSVNSMVPGTSTRYRQATLDGIMRDWSGVYENKIVRVVALDVNAGSLQSIGGNLYTIKSDQKSIKVNINSVSSQNDYSNAYAGGPMNLYVGDGRTGYTYSLDDFMSTAAHEFGHAGFHLYDLYHYVDSNGNIQRTDPNISNPFKSIMNNQFGLGGAQYIDYAILFRNKTWLRSDWFFYSSDPATLNEIIGVGKW